MSPGGEGEGGRGGRACIVLDGAYGWRGNVWGRTSQPAGTCSCIHNLPCLPSSHSCATKTRTSSNAAFNITSTAQELIAYGAKYENAYRGGLKVSCACAGTAGQQR